MLLFWIIALPLSVPESNSTINCVFTRRCLRLILLSRTTARLHPHHSDNFFSFLCYECYPRKCGKEFDKHFLDYYSLTFSMTLQNCDMYWVVLHSNAENMSSFAYIIQFHEPYRKSGAIHIVMQDDLTFRIPLKSAREFHWYSPFFPLIFL